LDTFRLKGELCHLPSCMSCSNLVRVIGRKQRQEAARQRMPAESSRGMPHMKGTSGRGVTAWPSLSLAVTAIFASYGKVFGAVPGTSLRAQRAPSRVVPNLGRRADPRHSPIGAGAPPISCRGFFPSNFPCNWPPVVSRTGRAPAARWAPLRSPSRARRLHAHDPFQRPHHRARRLSQPGL